jgi:hypothetical protein
MVRTAERKKGISRRDSTEIFFINLKKKFQNAKENCFTAEFLIPEFDFFAP